MRKVTLGTAPVGIHFACIGVVRDARTGKRLAAADTLRPYGFDEPAREDARHIAMAQGWAVS